MKFTLSWLKEFLDTEASVDEIADGLTRVGIEVEEIIDRAKGLEDFRVARVLEAKQHPDADRLRVCRVDTGEEVLEIVCGAHNARAGINVVLARPGMYVPGIDVTLKLAKIRGVTSNGMMLSGDELGISDDHSGIIEVDSDTPLGTPAVGPLGLDDPVFDVAITPNRADCLGVRGIARDLAAAGLGRLKPLGADPVPGSFKSPIDVILDFPSEAADACPYFVGRYIRGVKNCESPRWLKERLEAVGLRPISALVDVTNLLTIGHCRPLHVFDADKVHGNIMPRLARPGEKLQALDGKEYELDGEMTVIADERVPEALGGIIGGELSGCSDETVNVFLESAWFDPVRTATTGRKLNLQTDARFRFERGIDPAFLIDGAEIATRLILDLCGGEASELVIAGAEPAWRRTVELRADRPQTLCGVAVEPAKMAAILTDLGFGGDMTGETWSVSVPSWRNDVVGEACLVEEIVRINGYETIPTVPMALDTALPQAATSDLQRRRTRVRRALAARGLTEAVTFSFLSEKQADAFGGVPDSLKLANPISADLDVMRPSVLPNLVAALGRNADRGFPDGALYEVGPQFAGDAPEDEEVVAAGVRSGRSGPRDWTQAPRAVDVYDAKADALAALAVAGAPVDKLQVVAEAPAWYHPGRSGTLRLGPKNVLAHFGELHPTALRRMDVAGPMAAFEVFVDRLPAPKKRKSAAKASLTLSAFQPVSRDFAFVVADAVRAGDVLAAVRGADPALIADVRVFDVFTGGSLEPGTKSLAVTVVLQPKEKTLTDAELDGVATKIVARVQKATGGTLRS